MTTDHTREALIAAVRTIEVGPFGPNSMAILNRGGFTRLTPSEAEQVADVVQPILAALVEGRDAEIAQATAALEACVRDRNYAMRQRDDERRAKEGNIDALNEAIRERDEARAALAVERERAWDEGYLVGDPHQRRGDPAKAPNPYRIARSSTGGA